MASEPPGKPPDPSGDLDPIERLMIECLELPVDEREAALARACEEHPEWADRIRRRLDALRGLGLDPLSLAAGEVRFPERLGDFRLLSRIGGGGMGVVYLARQESLGRDVALKLIRPEQLYFPGARARFRREVEAVARLKHPGIVPVYAYGEEQGVPYFAMERIDGCTLADALRVLRERAPASLSGADLRTAIQRAGGEVPASASGAWRAFEGTWVQVCLRTIRQVAEALEHAHERGVLHRDLKPSNVVVTHDGRALLVDFGLASASGSDRVTRSGSQVGSLPYMPPEIWSHGAERLDARSDVYSLGVTLYELLTLKLPYAAPSVARLKLAIERGEYTPVHAANAAVPWDAETVCQTAMERDPARRYASAADFAHDLGNVLELRPIAARRPSALLRARRWIQRHPTASTAAAFSTLLLIVGPSVAAYEAKRSEARIREQKDLAVAEAQTSKAMVDYLAELFDSSSPFRPGVRDLSARELVEIGTQRLEGRFTDRPEVQARLQLHLGRMQMHLGRCDVALPMLEAASRWFREHSGPNAEETIDADVEIVEALRALGRYDEVEPLCRELIVRAEAAGIQRANTIVHLRAALGNMLGERGEYAQALQELRAARTNTAIWDGASPGMRAATLSSIGRYLVLNQETDAAEAPLREAIEMARAHREDPTCELELARAELELAQWYSMIQRDWESALPLAEEALAVFERLEGPSSMGVVAALSQLAAAELARGAFGRSIELERRVLELVRSLEGRNAWDEVESLTALADALTRARDSEASAIAREGLELARSLEGVDESTLANSAWHLAQALIAEGADVEARDLLADALPRQRTLGDAGAPRLAKILLQLGLAELRLGRPDAARPALVECFALRERAVGSSDPATAEADLALARCALALGQIGEAEERLRRAEPTILEKLGPDHRLSKLARDTWIELYTAVGDQACAEELRAESERR